MTTVLVCATPEVESDLGHTLFWRDDLERYVADRVEDAGALALTTEPHIVVVDLALRGADRLITGLRHQALPHPVSIVALTHDPDEAADNEEAASAVDTASLRRRSLCQRASSARVRSVSRSRPATVRSAVRVPASIV